MSLIEIKVPDIGDFKEVEVIELMVKVGDTIKVDQSLVTVESDKASMEIPSSAAGVIKEIKVKVGDKVEAGDGVLVIEAMKMENEIQAPIDGVVISVHVKKGDSVAPDETLAEIQ